MAKDAPGPLKLFFPSRLRAWEFGEADIVKTPHLFDNVIKLI